MQTQRFDVLLAGGGLAACICAWRVRQLRPELKVAVVESGRRLLGEQTWSFFEADLSAEQLAWLAPAIAHRWDGYEVVFPGRRRRLATPYCSVTSASLRAAVEPVLREGEAQGGGCFLEARVETVDADRIRLTDGRVLEAACVLDARGAGEGSGLDRLQLGYQKFLGQELRLARPHGLSVPRIMDATVPQLDGYRFVYVLPFGPRELLVEDTYYADGPGLDTAPLRGRIADYLAAHGWELEAVLREEEGVLPIALGGDVEALWDSASEGGARGGASASVPRIGLRAGLFHPTTGYSLPDAVETADRVARARELTTKALLPTLRAHALGTWSGRSFYRLLNRMLFRAGAPQSRWRVLERFYGLPEPLVQRFYAGRTTLWDKARILSGKPPVPLWEAMAQLRE